MPPRGLEIRVLRVWWRRARLPRTVPCRPNTDRCSRFVCLRRRRAPHWGPLYSVISLVYIIESWKTAFREPFRFGRSMVGSTRYLKRNKLERMRFIRVQVGLRCLWFPAVMMVMVMMVTFWKIVIQLRLLVKPPANSSRNRNIK